MKLSRLLSIVEFATDASLSEHFQSRCTDSLMYRYTPRGTDILIIHYLFQVQDTGIDQIVHGGLDEKMHQQPRMEECPPGRCNPALEQTLIL